MNIPEAGQSKTRAPQKIDDQKHFEVLNQIFKKQREYSYTELQDAIIYGFDQTFGQNASRQFITHYKERNWINAVRNKQKTIYSYARAIF
jgi:hypothetical protein